MIGICQLCRKEVKLQLIHIMPAFAIKWLKRTSPTHLRSAHEPNRRIQDGEKDYMLCSACEELFSGSEKIFYKQIFIPLNRNDLVTGRVPYGSWALKFIVSVSFRVLSFFMKLGLSDWPVEQQQFSVSALNVWRSFLLGTAPHPGEFEQHLLHVDVIESHTMPGMSPFMNRYLVRAFQIDAITSKNTAVVYAKLGRILLFGIIYEKNPNTWKGSKLSVKNGVIEPTDYHIPAGIMHYLNDQANLIGKGRGAISQHQNRKISEVILKDLNGVLSSELFRATQYDILHFGKAAMTPGQDNDESEKD